MAMRERRVSVFLPLMLCFFVMGFVDLVGIASNYVKADLALSDTMANVFPSLVFLWVIVLSMPTVMLLNRIGRKKTLLLALCATSLSLLLALVGQSFAVMLVAFSFLGIGNTLMQASLNPLVATMVGADRLASCLTLGHFFKAIASFLAPYLAMWGATSAMPSFGFGWKALFIVFLCVALVAALMVAGMPINDERQADSPSSLARCIRLMAHPMVLFSFLAIVCHVGIEVGINATAPKILMERMGMTLNEAAFSTSLYFIFGTMGCLTGTLLLQVMSNRRFYILCVALMSMGIAGLLLGTSAVVLYPSIAIMGYGNSNICALVLSQAMTSLPKHKNEISGLMVMGLFGGAVFPPIMGMASDAVGQTGAVAVVAIGVAYLALYATKMSRQQSSLDCGCHC